MVKIYKSTTTLLILFSACLLLFSLNLYAGEDDEPENTCNCISNPIVNFHDTKYSKFSGKGTYEFITVEKSNFNTSLMPSYYSEENACEPKKVLIVLYDVLGREAYSKAVIEDEAVISPSEFDSKLFSGVYMIIGASDHKLYKQKLAIE